MDKKNITKSSSIFLELLSIAFIVLKLTGIIDWSWVWVLSPIWITVALVLSIIIIIGIGVLISCIFKKQIKK